MGMGGNGNGLMKRDENGKLLGKMRFETGIGIDVWESKELGAAVTPAHL
jgi:hypothetical protein